MGISCLKEYLVRHGQDVTLADGNSQEHLKSCFDNYYAALRNHIPDDKASNYNNICHDIIHEHMMAHINTVDREIYVQLVKEIVYYTFYHHISDGAVQELTEIIGGYYRRLEEYVLQMLDRVKPTVFGLSVYSSTLPSSLFALRLAREKYPALKTIIGGGIFTNQLASGAANLDFFLEKTGDYIDKIIIGEGEILLLKYLKGELPPHQRVYSIRDIDGEVLDIKTVGIPAIEDFDLEYYQHIAVYGSRSCPLSCSFCSETVIWGAYRMKESAQIVNEFKQLYKIRGSQLFLMCDSLLNPILTKMSKELIKEPLSFYFDGYLRADKAVCNIENTMNWRRAGFYRARLGIESGSPKILEAMEKKVTPQQIVDAVSCLAEAGIKTTTYWIVGFPGETEEDFQATLDMLDQLKDKIYEADVNPFGFTLTGQVNSGDWTEKNKPYLLYPEYAKDMLITQSWVLDCEPSRAETFRRLSRFVEHCKKLGIPNPYSLYDIYQADERWKRLHKNAVPRLVDFENSNGQITENKKIKKLELVQRVPQEDGDFAF